MLGVSGEKEEGAFNLTPRRGPLGNIATTEKTIVIISEVHVYMSPCVLGPSRAKTSNNPLQVAAHHFTLVSCMLQQRE